MPAVGKYQPTALSIKISDLNLADLALAALSSMRNRGPAGLLLADVRQYFKNNLGHMSRLARYSLETGLLITPIRIPYLSNNNYQKYSDTYNAWKVLGNRSNIERILEQEVLACIAIHQSLLECAEEVCYPAYQLLLDMLQLTENASGKPWQQIWQEYLSDQIISGEYIFYQEAILLWAALFPEQQDIQQLANLILEHYNGSRESLNRFARRFLSTLSNEMRDIQDQKDNVKR